MNKIQLRERIGGTVLRLGWLLGIATFIPTLFYLLYYAFAVAQILYFAVLAILILATFFLILFNEGFRKAFDSQNVDVLPLVQKVYSAFSTVLPILFVAGLCFALASLVLSLKAKNGKVSFKRLLSSILLIVFLCIGLITYYATKSKIMGVSV
ncbi:MAG: hypothetical protein HDT32_00315 [Clostridiales bacterium]|nr:hypothetical protein [Clostridiales bacterium]